MEARIGGHVDHKNNRGDGLAGEFVASSNQVDYASLKPDDPHFLDMAWPTENGPESTAFAKHMQWRRSLSDGERTCIIFCVSFQTISVLHVYAILSFLYWDFRIVTVRIAMAKMGYLPTHTNSKPVPVLYSGLHSAAYIAGAP